MRSYFIFLFFILLIVNVNALNSTGETITGHLSKGISMSISVIAGAPIILIIYPLNGTYFVDTSIPLSYSVAGELNTIWYKIDSGNNTIINSSIYFNTPEGSHTLYLYANNSIDNTTMESVNFTVNLTKFRIIGDKWTGNTKGNSTNFTILSYEEIQNLSNIVLEDINYGKILFNQNINMTDDSNFSDNQVDINSSISISSNRIKLNLTELPNFNKRATLWLYGLTFSNPRVLIDGEVCPSFICTKESYSGGILKFNVTQLSIFYSAEETPSSESTTPPTSSGGGGGGGGIFGFLIPKVTSFSINTSEIKVSTIAGKVITKKITIKNNLNRNMEITITQKNLGDFLVLKENKLNLAPNESREVSLDFMVREGTSPDLYLGKVILTNDHNEQQEILTVIEVQSEGALLDVNVEIQPEYVSVSPNNDILAKISFFNVETDNKKRDINVEYIIENENREQILEEKETISIETQTSWIKRFKIPPGTGYGKYILYVKATTQEGKVASATDFFEVVAPKTIIIYLLIIILAIMLGLVIYFRIIRDKKRRKTDLVNKRRRLK